MDALLTFLGGAGGAALVSCIFALVQKRMARNDNHTKALRYLMLYIIQDRALHHIKTGEITLEERRSLHHWHSLYHDGLGGNGDADDLMAQVDKLPIDPDNR